MALKLNPERKAYEEFYGRNVDKMPALLADGRSPISIARVEQNRLAYKNGPEDVKTGWTDSYFDTSDLKAQRGDEIKLVLTTHADGSLTPLGREYLGLINPEEGERLVRRGAVNLGIGERYEKLQGDGVIVTQRGKLAKVIDEWMTQEQVKDSLFWRVILRHPDEVPAEFAIPGLHGEAIPYIFGEYQARFAKGTSLDNIEAMGVFPGQCDKNTSEMRAWVVGMLGYRSVADGRDGLNYDDGRFVGFSAGGAERAEQAGSETTKMKAYTTADLKAVDEAMEGLEGFLNPEVLKPFRELRRKL